MPTPRAVSYSTIAPANPPLAEATMTASEVAMNSALPTPPAGPEADDAADAGRRPGRRAEDHDHGQAGDQRLLAPSRLDTQLVISMATAVTTR